MSHPPTTKRRETATGVKALIAAAAVAATVAGWALLPANDPPTATAAPDPTTGQPELGVPNGGGTAPTTGSTEIQPTQPQTTLPQTTAPRSFSRQPFTRSYSSR